MKAFSPGHITAFFSPIYNDDPLETGSIGAGITTKKGVYVDLELSDSNSILIEGKKTEFEPIENVLDLLKIEAEVEITPQVPLGCGFGISGGATLATALAANNAANLDLNREQVVAAAHVAEIKANTGLGDVVAQSLGGVVTRIEQGTLGLGRFGSIETEIEKIDYKIFGELDTSEILHDRENMRKKLKQKAEKALSSLTSSPSIENLIDLSWEFAVETDLPPQKVKNEVKKIRENGGKASMAMLGETVFGVNSNKFLKEETKIAEEGARILK